MRGCRFFGEKTVVDSTHHEVSGSCKVGISRYGASLDGVEIERIMLVAVCTALDVLRCKLCHEVVFLCASSWRWCNEFTCPDCVLFCVSPWMSCTERIDVDVLSQASRLNWLSIGPILAPLLDVLFKFSLRQYSPIRTLNQVYLQCSTNICVVKTENQSYHNDQSTLNYIENLYNILNRFRPY